MGKTAISWTDHSINPIRARHVKTGAVGHYCEKVSHGCTNCYASAFQKRFQMPAFGAGQHRREVEPFLDEEKLLEVIRRRKPTKFFWCDMSDLFGRWVPDGWIDVCFAAMALTGHHTHQVLTKRSKRMWAYLNGPGVSDRIYKHFIRLALAAGIKECEFDNWPWNHVWLGVSAEDQDQWDTRVGELWRTPARVRFVSVEPMLGPIEMDLSTFVGIHWIIFGGESGLHARPCDLTWIDHGVGQCRFAGVAAFVKQAGRLVEVGGMQAKLRGDLARWALRAGGTIRADGVIEVRLKDPKGGDLAELPASVRVREFPDGGGA